jgi:hypothetical protein
MFRTLRSFRRILFAGILVAGLATAFVAQAQDAPARGRKYKAPPATSVVEVTVLRATNGKPVQNASVIFHPLVNGRDNGNMELKTNDDGKAIIDLLEIGSNVRVQVIAPGFQTYGEDYKIDKDKIAIDVKLKRPQAQYSVYKQNDGAKTEGEKAPDAGADKPKAPEADSSPNDVPPPVADAPKPDSKPADASTPK